MCKWVNGEEGCRDYFVVGLSLLEKLNLILLIVNHHSAILTFFPASQPVE